MSANCVPNVGGRVDVVEIRAAKRASSRTGSGGGFEPGFGPQFGERRLCNAKVERIAAAFGERIARDCCVCEADMRIDCERSHASSKPALETAR